MALLISVSEFWEDEKIWRQWVQAELPEMDVRVHPDDGDVNEIKYVATWKHPHGILKKYPNLKAILSLGAGVDHILSDPDLPEDLPIVRLVDPKLTHEMCFHALHWVLHFHSDHFLYMKQQMDKKWQQQGSIQPEDRAIGIIGLGNIGRGIGDSIVNQGFKVLGWGANQKSSLDDIQYFFGDEQLGDFLEKTDILINVLPLTESTTNILRKHELQHLPRGAFIINMGRGCIFNEADLLSLLDEGHIAAAAMDVFEEEPLPANNRLWSHPSVYITPHIAGQSNPQSSAKTIAKNIRRIEDGKMPFPIYNITKGY